MNTLYMKIHEFDADSHSLIVSFASDQTKSKDPNDYGRVAFQPATMWPDVTDLNEIKKRLAVAGVWHAERQARLEFLEENPGTVNNLKSLVGQSEAYSISSLTSAEEAFEYEVSV